MLGLACKPILSVVIVFIFFKSCLPCSMGVLAFNYMGANGWLNPSPFSLSQPLLPSG